ncbi:hypothetical protein [uncultured Corynebacterium sp.]|uniref:hypothetical protein n=1 Tax=uncultured Corynebacterium sp. TaxID=159447 RepID=UPI0025EEF446|nr:hypothetical protein [uncultured Corynebacterium sp.]
MLLVPLEHHRGFQYKVTPVTTPVPSFGGRRAQSQEDYLRLELFDQTGTQGYDLNGLTRQQIIDDVIGRDETHLGFLTVSASTDTRPRLTPPVTPVAEPSLIKNEE